MRRLARHRRNGPGGAGCPAANAPMAIAAEGQAPNAGSMTTTAAVVEQFGEIRYVTLIY